MRTITTPFFLGHSGPAMSGTLVKKIGFEWMLFGIAILNFLYAPLLISLKNPPTKEEKKVSTTLPQPKKYNPSGDSTLFLLQILYTSQ
jgi:hypothetical protein